MDRFGWSRASAARLGQARTGTPFSSRSCFNSPVSNISRTMSQPPTNSPCTYSWGTVGQFENSLMPWRTEGSARTSMPLNLTPRWLRIWTTAAEKPHCGKTGVPFMKSTTGASPICWRMRSCRLVSIVSVLVCGAPQRGLERKPRSGFRSIRGGARLQRERVQLVAHPAAQRLIDQLMLLDPAFAAEPAGDDAGGVVIAVAPQILDRD